MCLRFAQYVKSFWYKYFLNIFVINFNLVKEHTHYEHLYP